MRLVLLALLITGACVLAAELDVPTALEKLGDSPSRVVVYSLAPHADEATPPDQMFHTYPIRGRADVTDPNEQRALLRALADGARGADPMRVGACFNTRHGLRVEQGSYSADFVICFECLQVQSCGFRFAEDFHISDQPQSAFDGSLRRHNLPLPDK